MATGTLFNERMPSATSCLLITVVFISTWMMCVISSNPQNHSYWLIQGCQRRLDPLLSYPAWVRRTKPTGISNDAMGSVPQHHFFLKVMESLQAYDRHWFLPYITVMYSTGPLFLSVIWKEYMPQSFGMDRVRVLMPDEYNGFPWSFFTHNVGNSWHGADAQLIFWVCPHVVWWSRLVLILIDVPLLVPADCRRLHYRWLRRILHVDSLRTSIITRTPLPLHKSRIQLYFSPQNTPTTICHNAQLLPTYQRVVDIIRRRTRSQRRRLLWMMKKCTY
jgi:hypothetical protein